MSFETERTAMIPIPAEVLRVYSRFRPTPLFRASRFEHGLGTTCQIFIKDESATPTGNHKANNSYAIAYLCASTGIRELTTETTGNWGVALSLAAKEFGLKSLCFLDETSDTRRPRMKSCIKEQGGKVVIVRRDDHHRDLLQLSADAAIEATRQLTDAAYIFGSVYGYFVVPQSMMGIEALQQLASLGKYPDVVVGSCGGGANLLGIAAPFLIDRLTNASDVRVVSAESEKCPIRSRGRSGVYSVDSSGLDGAPGSGSYFTRAGRAWSKRVKDDVKSDHQGQISYAFDRGEPMSIVAEDKGPLREADAYVDLVAHGNGSESFPNYVALTEETILRSIIYPLVHDGDRIGVINLESTEYLNPNGRLKGEFSCMADSINLPLRSHEGMLHPKAEYRPCDYCIRIAQGGHNIGRESGIRRLIGECG